MPGVSLVVPAAGLGARMGASERKPYIHLRGQPIVFRTLARFAELDEIREIVLVVHPDDVESVQQQHGPALKQLKVSTVCAGGRERQDSVYNGLRHTSPECDVVLIQDAVRPIISGDLIRRTIAAVRRHGAAIVAAPVKETVKEVDDEGRIVATRPREGLWLAQTPQGFRRDLILAAHEAVQAQGMAITDDAQAVEAFGAPVYVVPGGYDNLKITTPEDLLIAEALIERQSRQPPPR